MERGVLHIPLLLHRLVLSLCSAFKKFQPWASASVCAIISIYLFLMDPNPISDSSVG